MDAKLEKEFYAQFTDIDQAYEDYQMGFALTDEQPLSFDRWLQMEKDLFASNYHDERRYALTYYDYEKENHKTCPVCLKVIDYHVDGFFHDEVLNIWICRDHKLVEILGVIGLRDASVIKFILSQEVPGLVYNFMNAYNAACDAMNEMSRLWEDALCADAVQNQVQKYPDYLPSFDEFVVDFRNIWKRE